MILFESARMMRIIVLPPMRKPCSEVKQLQCTEQRWQYPKEQQVGLIYPNLKYIKRAGHNKYLTDGQVLLHEVKIPCYKIAPMVIRIKV